MKKIIVLVVLMLFLSACGQNSGVSDGVSPTGAVVLDEKKNVIEEVTSVKEVVSVEPVEQVESAETVSAVVEPVESPPLPVDNKIIVEKSLQFSPELRDLLQKADSEVKSVSYVYSESPGNVGFDTYLIKGAKMKILLMEKNDYVIDDYFNAVYVDSVAKTAKGRCENRKRCLSKAIDNTKRVYDLSFEQYRKKTAYEWIKSVGSAEIVGFETLNNHAVTRIKSEKDGLVVEMWVDNRFGLPHKISIVDGEDVRTYYFKNMVFNSLKDSDVVMPSS